MFILYRDSLFNEENIKKTVQAEMNFNFQKTQEAEKLDQEKKDLVQQEEIRRQKLLRYSFTFGFILMLLLAVIIFRNNKQKQRANIELANKNELIKIQKKEVEFQKELLQEKNLEIIDSISYAERIQTSFLTSEKYISQRLTDYFILFNPRNIVSGDFYWIMEKHSSLYVCTADCTGHGIPGAFMSLIGMGILNEIIYSKSHIKHTDEIFNELRRIIILALNPEGISLEGKDGMDAVLCRYDFQKMELEYSAANNPFYIVRNGELLEFKPDKMPVGKYLGEEKPFTRTIISLEKGDCIYTFTDGYIDQFGGPNGKKFMSKQLKELLLANSHESMGKQKEIINKSLTSWKGNFDQVDDILVMGIRV
jgi:serine phosphatase RsbU (regulator of sigma subunit)